MLVCRLLVLAWLASVAGLALVAAREARQELHEFAVLRQLVLSAPAAAAARHCHATGIARRAWPLQCTHQLAIFTRTGTSGLAGDICASPTADATRRRRRYQLRWQCRWWVAGIPLALPPLRTTIVR